MSGADTAWAFAPELHSRRMFQLAGALIASVLAHALLLSWPVPLSPGGAAAAASPASATLRVSLELAAEATSNPAREDAAAPPSLGAAAQAETPPRAPGAQDAIPLHGYYPAASLSRMPEGIGVFDIQAPEGGDTGLGGKLTLRIWISAKGEIDSLRVLASDLPAQYERAALAAFEKMRFAPGEIQGVPVQSWVDVVIEYADFRSAAAPAPATRQ